MAIIPYWPEMQQAKPEAQGEVSYGYRGKHYIKTPLTLKGRGITHIGVLTANSLAERAQHKAGWNEYVVTRRALDTLSEKFTFSRECLLD